MRQSARLVKKVVFLIVFALGVVIAFFQIGGIPTRAAYVVNISIADNSFDRTDVTVTAGDTIIWKNNGQNPHTVTQDSGIWTSGTLSVSQSFAFTFTQAGTYEYHCQFHPEMKGKIKVLPQTNPTPTPAPSPIPSQAPQVTTNTIPECVSLSASPTIGGARLNVSFTGKGRDPDGIIRRMDLNFGDGETKTVDIPNAGTNQDTLSVITHTYRSPGTFNATLRVKDNSGQANEWSTIPESCKVKIEAQGNVLAGAQTTGIPTTPTTLSVSPTILPKAGVSEWLTVSYFISGFGGMMIKFIERTSRRNKSF